MRLLIFYYSRVCPILKLQNKRKTKAYQRSVVIEMFKKTKLSTLKIILNILKTSLKIKWTLKSQQIGSLAKTLK